MDKKKAKTKLKSYAKYSGLGFQMVAIILLGVFGGVKLDEYINIEFPVFTVVLALLSVMIAIYFAVKDFIKMK